MLAKTTSDNVLPIESTSRPLGSTGRQIGAILMAEGKLTEPEAEQVLKRQRELGWRFGEAAIELNFITNTDLREALAKQYEFPYLASGPEGVSRELIAAWDPFHPAVEELRRVRTQLLIRWFDPGAGRRTLAVASACAREGRSFVAANLAVVFSQLGQRTLLIDADFRAPRQQSIFNVADRFGLSSALSGRADLSVAVPVTGLAGLAVLPSGPVPPNPLELLSRPGFAALLAKAQSEYDFIIIDTPPVTEYADAQCVAFRTGDAMLVSRKDHTRMADTEQAVRDLTEGNARVVGTLINAY
ncbi:MAG: putative non-specific protein-tyrosine kinase EpsG-like protein [Burkholderiales bacterium]|jgi:receptor protein-tyrosine kinase|nr:putative non-specific protein-tyrosine kinase EpsG-like protein [Burkholderiales bacterium]